MFDTRETPWLDEGVPASRIRRAIDYPFFLAKFTRIFLRPPEFEGARVTPKRLWNLYKLRWAINRGSTALRSYPAKLTVEPTSVCNLECPACFTGAGEVGRARAPMSLDLYRRLLAEMGDYLFQVEFYNWGEPLLAKNIYTMVEEASARGLSTVVSSNLSFPFDAERAERLVRSRLAVLGVSIDGARQETYEQYRVRGNLETVLRNVRLVNEAKRRLGSATPKLIWSFHVFPHNADDVEQARAMATELDMEFAVEKGWVVGDEWDPDGRFTYYGNPRPFPCVPLWEYAVLNNDGGVAPCCGSFYREDDVGRVAADGRDGGARTFREVWNGPGLRRARGFYSTRDGDEAARRSICFDCPQTVIWERWQHHMGGGGLEQDFDPGYGQNDVFNYFWTRQKLHRPPSDAPRRARG